MSDVHVVFVPDGSAPRFFLWGDRAAESALAAGARADRAAVVDESMRARSTEGLSLPLLDGVARLARMSAADAERAPASMAAWSAASKLALELVARERVVPRAGQGEARSAAALARADDAERVAALARAFPLAAHGLAPTAPAPATRGRGKASARSAAAEVWAPEPLLRRFLDHVADALVRAAAEELAGPAAKARPAAKRGTASPVPAGLAWERRLVAALTGPDPSFAPDGFAERSLAAELDGWARPALGSEPGAPRVCFRLDLPGAPPTDEDDLASGGDGAGDAADNGAGSEAAAASFPLRFFLQAASDPSLLVPSAEVLSGRGRGLRRLGFPAAEEHLLRSLASAVRLFEPIERGLREARPASVQLDVGEAWAFLSHGATALADAGMGVILPAELTRAGRRRLRLRMRVGAGAKTPSAKSSGMGLGLDELTRFRWEVALAGETLSERDLRALARLKAPLVRFRGRWVAVDPAELEEARRLLAAGPGMLAGHEALAAVLAGTDERSGIPVDVVAEGKLAEIAARLRGRGEGRADGTDGADAAVAEPPGFHGTLRPYQSRGLGWLAMMAELGLGACLADDMGLGKTIQLLAFLLRRRAERPGDARPALLVCPTSVVGNWEREASRFAPELPVVRHHGPERADSASALAAARGALVVTTYGLLRRDAEVLAAVDWSVVALDEAQNIKNPGSRAARAARALRADFRVALTGTPVENHLGELWSLSEYLNPRLLGPLERFRREVAVPIERHGRDDVAEGLRRVIRPFLLRREKSDPSVVRDLPPRQESTVVCTLSREQATLYRAAVDEAMRRIASSEGIQRRGLVLALITALKQICNHPAHYLGQPGPLGGRSGKLERLREMMEEVVGAGDRALVFTQFREMGDRLVIELERALAVPVPFLHGGVGRAARDAMVEEFQAGGAPVMVLSLRAGGSGLNLTAASHVFHFDRWWNPAVEDQASDRVHRIGQRRAVHIHRLVCAGTVEEKVGELLERKRGLASRIVGRGEQWVTELDDDGLRQLFALSSDAAVADGDDAPARPARSRRRR